MVQALRNKYIAILFLCDDLIIKLDIVSQSCCILHAVQNKVQREHFAPRRRSNRSSYPHLAPRRIPNRSSYPHLAPRRIPNRSSYTRMISLQMVELVQLYANSAAKGEIFPIHWPPFKRD
jgi:hypothetical protein